MAAQALAEKPSGGQLCANLAYAVLPILMIGIDYPPLSENWGLINDRANSPREPATPSAFSGEACKDQVSPLPDGSPVNHLASFTGYRRLRA
jgi:hypothetical protein